MMARKGTGPRRMVFEIRFKWQGCVAEAFWREEGRLVEVYR
jgi:hypothetical protein